MDMAKPKGEVVGSITLHFNTKMQVSHVEIKDRGDLVSKRTIQDSMMLIFRAINQMRAKRKTSGRVAEAEKVRQAEQRDTSRLDRWRKKKAEEQAKADQELIDQALAKKAEKEGAAEKATKPVYPGYKPEEGTEAGAASKPKMTAEEKKALARKEADEAVNAMLAAKPKGKNAPIQPVTG